MLCLYLLTQLLPKGLADGLGAAQVGWWGEWWGEAGIYRTQL